ncbi:hypothetical protein A2U01_0110957, partial [Trifolium medium]|nr:hypothetical protein [Trifolium medium]
MASGLCALHSSAGALR